MDENDAAEIENDPLVREPSVDSLVAASGPPAPDRQAPDPLEEEEEVQSPDPFEEAERVFDPFEASPTPPVRTPVTKPKKTKEPKQPKQAKQPKQPKAPKQPKEPKEPKSKKVKTNTGGTAEGANKGWTKRRENEHKIQNLNESVDELTKNAVALERRNQEQKKTIDTLMKEKNTLIAEHAANFAHYREQQDGIIKGLEHRINQLQDATWEERVQTGEVVPDDGPNVWENSYPLTPLLNKSPLEGLLYLTGVLIGMEQEYEKTKKKLHDVEHQRIGIKRKYDEIDKAFKEVTRRHLHYPAFKSTVMKTLSETNQLIVSVDEQPKHVKQELMPTASASNPIDLTDEPQVPTPATTPAPRPSNGPAPASTGTIARSALPPGNVIIPSGSLDLGEVEDHRNRWNRISS